MTTCAIIVASTPITITSTTTSTAAADTVTRATTTVTMLDLKNRTGIPESEALQAKPECLHPEPWTVLSPTP